MSKQVVGVCLVSAMLVTLAGCGNSPVGPTTVTQNLVDLCQNISDATPASMRALLITINATRNDGISEAESLAILLPACHVEQAYLDCKVCFAEMVHHVYTH